MLVQNLELNYLRMTVPENEGQHAQSVYSPAYKFGGAGRFAFSKEMYDELDRLNNYDSHAKQITADWSRFLVGDTDTVIEKSPPNLTKIDWLRKVFPNSKFIIITRDPRATSAATQKWSKSSLEELMMHWNVAYSKALVDCGEKDSIFVRYEDLVDAPIAVRTKIKKFLKVKNRTVKAAIDPRFEKVTDTNEKYISRHSCKSYGVGVWNQFGYDI
jgi:hypothetical protein